MNIYIVLGIVGLIFVSREVIMQYRYYYWYKRRTSNARWVSKYFGMNDDLASITYRNGVVHTKESVEKDGWSIDPLDMWVKGSDGYNNKVRWLENHKFKSERERAMEILQPSGYKSDDKVMEKVTFKSGTVYFSQEN